MNAFAAWGLSILGLAVVATIAEMLLPQGKLRTVIRSVVATVTALVMVTPLPDLIKNGFSFDFGESGSATVEQDEEYLEYIEEAKRTLIETAARQYLNEQGYDAEIQVEIDGNFTVKSVAVKFTETGITENDEHIHKSEIKRLIADYFDIGEEAIMTYG